MSRCGFMDTCDFRDRLRVSAPALAKEYDGAYCLANHEDCARHMVALRLGESRVPPDLFPFDRARAENTIEIMSRWIDKESPPDEP